MGRFTCLYAPLLSSRFSKESGSEEILIPERECEYPPLCDIRQQTMDDSMDDDDEYTPTQQAKKSIQPTTTNERKKTTTDILPIWPTSGEYLFGFSVLQ
jgi:hypothetical protein